MTDLAHGLTGTKRATARAATRLLNARPNTPHTRLAAAMRNLHQARTDHPLRDLEIVTASEVTAPYIRAVHHTPRLIGSGLRHNIPLGNTRHCPGCGGQVHPVTLACACYTPPRKDA